MENVSSPVNTNKVPFDPGWNDPPSLTYNAQQITPSRPRNFLNKRVAFPLSGSSSNSSPVLPPATNLPPMTSSGLPPPVQTIKPTEDVEIDSESILKEVKETLLQCVNNCSGLDTKWRNDIERRLGAMEEMWSNDKLNKQVQVQMCNLAHAIKEENFHKADEIHKVLMVNHISAVGTWMPGVKHLIHHCSAQSELLAIDKE